MGRYSMAPLSGLIGALMLVGFTTTGCGGDSTPTADATLQEFTIKLNKQNLDSGKVKFDVTNDGGTTHEFVVVRADDAESLPTKTDGSVDEDKIEETAAIGEIEDIEPKDSGDVTFDLDPGTYVAFCNIVQDGDPPVSHFEKGMHVQFTVND
jgi:uncharacterized cupredoxin-like copper-binding protein